MRSSIRSQRGPFPSSRRSFIAKAAAAVVAGFTAGNLLRSLASGATRRKGSVSVRPHHQAVPRSSTRPSSHE